MHFIASSHCTPYTVVRNSSFTAINSSSAPERLVSQPPRALSAQYEPTASPLRQMILEASEALADLPKKRRKRSRRKSQLEEEDFESRTQNSKKKQRKQSQASTITDAASFASTKEETAALEAPSKDERQAVNADRLLISQATLNKLGAFRFRRHALDAQNKTDKAKRHDQGLSTLFSEDTELIAPVQGPEKIEEDDACYDIHNSFLVEENEVETDENTMIEDDPSATFHISEESEPPHVIIPQNSDIRGIEGAESEASDLSSSVDEFPMDKDILEEATHQVQNLDRQMYRDDEDAGPSRNTWPMKRWTMGSQWVADTSDPYTDETLLVEVDATKEHSDEDEPGTHFGACGNVPITPPPRQRQMQEPNLTYATSSSFQEDQLSSLGFQPVSLDSPVKLSKLPQSTTEMTSTTPGRESTTAPLSPFKAPKPSKPPTVRRNSTIPAAVSSLYSNPRSANSSCQHSAPDNSNRPLSAFLRPPFPDPLSQYSTLSSATPTSRLLICFRTAEILKAVASASSQETVMLYLEVYCRVILSTRSGTTQQFTFADIFLPDTCPLISGTYEGWKGSELWEHDTAAFLEDLPKMARAIITPVLVRNGSNSVEAEMEKGVAKGKWFGKREKALEVKVQNIWEASWEDVRWARGIVEA